MAGSDRAAAVARPAAPQPVAQPASRPGVAFPGQGVSADAVLAALHRHRDHRLVEALLAGVEAPSIGALDLADTRTYQAATYTAGLTEAQRRYGAGVWAPVVVGHSLGEITALAFAGVLSAEDGLRLALTRGRICQAVQGRRPGAMAAVVGLGLDGVERLRCRVLRDTPGTLEIAGINAGRQIVLSGDRAAVAALVEAAGEAAARAVPLPIGGAFHSTLMAEALPQWRQALRAVPMAAGRTTVVSCIDSRPHREPEVLRELLAAALVLPVRWVETLEAVRGLGVRQLWEAGPGSVLRSLARRGAVVEFVEEPN